MGERLVDDPRVFDASDQFEFAGGDTAGLNVDIEHPLQALGLRLIAARRVLGGRSFLASAVWGLTTFASLRRRHLGAIPAVWGRRRRDTG
jgi:hypothetical protein